MAQIQKQLRLNAIAFASDPDEYLPTAKPTKAERKRLRRLKHPRPTVTSRTRREEEDAE